MKPVVSSVVATAVYAVVLAVFVNCEAAAEKMEILETAEARIVYEPGVYRGAEKVSRYFPEIKKKTESLYGWRFPDTTTIVLVNNRGRFLKHADHPITIAYAVPGENLIVLDFATTSSKPFSLETTLTHEFCHLLLHRYVPGIPRWLDEGLCQWTSGGLDEILYDRKRAALNQAAISGRFIPFKSIESVFPRYEGARILAYEQSKSFVAYLARRFGPDKLREVLNEMKKGESFDRASSTVYLTSFEELEQDWRDSIRRDWTWLAYIGNHIYTFLFVAAALATVIGFVRFLRKKRRYRDEYWDGEDDEDDYFDF